MRRKNPARAKWGERNNRRVIKTATQKEVHNGKGVIHVPNVLVVPLLFPVVGSTSATEICTDAWSLAFKIRFVQELPKGGKGKGVSHKYITHHRNVLQELHTQNKEG